MGTTNAYNETYTYDANGNIKTLVRYDRAATPVKIDDLTYGYNLDGNGNLINNKLNHIDDPVSSLLCSYDIDDQSQDNYLYDAIGNLTKDNAEEIDNIEWNAYGKIKKIIRTFSSAEKSLEFVYDAQGNRVCKIVKPRYANMDGTKTRDEWDTYNSASWLYTFYVRDASGNIMTTYTKTGSEIENNVLKLDEVMLYGSGRIGTREIGVELTNITIPTAKFSRTLGLKRYEIGNHLGNVLTTFTDRKYQIQNTGVVTGYKTYIASAQDYYPFGMIMNERKWNTSGYRFGFNGMEKDDEIKGSGNSLDFGARIYDSRIGKWLSVDPLQKKYSYFTPYLFCANNPIIFIDIDGREIEITAPEGSKEYLKISNALEAIKKSNPKLYSDLQNMPEVIQIGIGKLNSDDCYESFADLSGKSILKGNCSLLRQSSLTVTPVKDESGELIGGKIFTYKTSDEQEADRAKLREQANGDENLYNQLYNDYLKNKGTRKEISEQDAETKVELLTQGVNKDNKKIIAKIVIDNKMNISQGEWTKTVKHELGHAHFGLFNKVKDWIWAVIGNKNLGGHDANNPTGEAAVNAEKDKYPK